MKLLPYNSEKGFTLVEVLVALFIIALVILGGGMFFFYGRVTIVREAHRRAAVLVASQRLEELKAAEWDYIAPEGVNKGFRYYLMGGGSWSWIQPEVSGDDPPEDAEETVDNLPDGEMVTEAQWVGDDYLEVTVTVHWGDRTTNSVSSTTLIAP